MQTDLAPALPEGSVRVPAGTPLWGEIYDFLTVEAELLDDDQHTAWLDLLTADIRYQIPIRKTVYRSDGRGIDSRNNHFNDNRASLELRVRRNVDIGPAFDRDPAPRIRRLVSNITVHQTPAPDEYSVKSSILLLHSRFDDFGYHALSGRRYDEIRRTPEGLRLARRTVHLDQSLLGSPYFNVFL